MNSREHTAKLAICLCEQSIPSYITMLKENNPPNTIIFSYTRMSDDQAAALADVIASHTSLEELHMRGNQLSDDGIKKIAKALYHNKSIRVLDLSYNRMAYESAMYIADVLSCNRTLRRLCLGSNQIGDQGAEKLARALLLNQSLHYLELSYNELTAIGVNHIIEALKLNHTLTDINLYPAILEKTDLHDTQEENSFVNQITLLLNCNEKINKILKSPQQSMLAVRKALLPLLDEKQNVNKKKSEKNCYINVPSLFDTLVNFLNHRMSDWSAEKKAETKEKLPQDIYQRLSFECYSLFGKDEPNENERNLATLEHDESAFKLTI